MAFINRVVDKVYVINLDKDVERMEAISGQLRAQGIEFTRFSAIKGAGIKKSKYLSDFCETLCTDGMKGCALSHRFIWDDMVANGYERILVLEDDAVLSENFNGELEKAWTQLPDDFDLFYLGCNVKCTDTALVPKLIHKVMNSTPEQLTENILSVNGSFGTHGYIITKECAKVFQQLPIDTHIDLQMEIWTTKFNLNAYSITPLIVSTTGNNEGKGSNLTEAYPFLLNKVLRQIPFADTMTFDWSLSENFAKIGPFNLNGILAILMVAILLVPGRWIYPVLFPWLLLEFLFSLDVKNTVKFLFFIGLAHGIRYTTVSVVWPFAVRSEKAAIKTVKRLL